MKYTPITINKKTKTHKDKGGKEKKYIYYEAVCTVQLAKKSYRETGNGKTRRAAKDALLKKLDARVWHTDRESIPWDLLCAG